MRTYQALHAAIIPVYNALTVCRNLNQAFGWALTPDTLAAMDPVERETALACIGVWAKQKPGTGPDGTPQTRGGTS